MIRCSSAARVCALGRRTCASCPLNPSLVAGEGSALLREQVVGVRGGTSTLVPATVREEQVPNIEECCRFFLPRKRQPRVRWAASSSTRTSTSTSRSTETENEDGAGFGSREGTKAASREEVRSFAIAGGKHDAESLPPAIANERIENVSTSTSRQPAEDEPAATIPWWRRTKSRLLAAQAVQAAAGALAASSAGLKRRLPFPLDGQEVERPTEHEDTTPSEASTAASSPASAPARDESEQAGVDDLDPPPSSRPTPLPPTSSFYKRPLPETKSVISFQSPLGQRKLAECILESCNIGGNLQNQNEMNHEQTSHSDQSQSGNHTNGSQYAALSEQFLTQSRPPLCGPSSIVMVLNSLNVDPRRVWQAPWRWVTEDMLLQCLRSTVAACQQSAASSRASSTSGSDTHTAPCSSTAGGGAVAARSGPLHSGKDELHRSLQQNSSMSPAPTSLASNKNSSTHPRDEHLSKRASCSTACDAFKKRVAAEGVTMEEFAYLCERNGLFVETYYAEQNQNPSSPGSIQNFRRTLARLFLAGASPRTTGAPQLQQQHQQARNIGSPSPTPQPGPSRLVVSFSRTALGQTGDGHYSPVAAYHQGSDMVLVLDVARFKYPPYWVSVDTLWRAMHARDAVTECARGWFVMSGGDQDQDGRFLPAVGGKGGGDPGRTVIRAAALQYGQDLRRKIVTQGTRTRTSTAREDERRTTLGFLEELRGLRDKVKALEGALAEKDGAAVQAGSLPSDSNCPVVRGHNLWKMHSRHEEELDCLLTLAHGGAALDSLLEHCSEGLKAEVKTLRGFLAAEQQKASE